MNTFSAFDVWAPDDGAWTEWVKPVVFAHFQELSNATGAERLREGVRRVEMPWCPRSGDGVAVIVDLPGAEALQIGLALAMRGFRPVPLHNSSPHANAIVDLELVLEWFRDATAILRELDPSHDGPPAFLLDSRRMTGTPGPLRYDNRWMVFPQDLPSANALRRRGINSAIVVQAAGGQPADDLRHILRRWQEAGVAILTVNPADNSQPSLIEVTVPSRFRAVWHRWLAMIGLRRNSAGGFGAIVPEPSSSGGGVGWGGRGFG